MAGLGHAVGAGNGRGEGEQLHGDVDRPEEERLLPLEPSLIDQHAVEDGACEPAARAIGEADVTGELAVGRVPWPRGPAEPAGGVPPGVEAEDPGYGAQAVARARPRVGERARPTALARWPTCASARGRPWRRPRWTPAASGVPC